MLWICHCYYDIERFRRMCPFMNIRTRWRVSKCYHNYFKPLSYTTKIDSEHKHNQVFSCEKNNYFGKVRKSIVWITKYMILVDFDPRLCHYTVYIYKKLILIFLLQLWLRLKEFISLLLHNKFICLLIFLNCKLIRSLWEVHLYFTAWSSQIRDEKGTLLCCWISSNKSIN